MAERAIANDAGLAVEREDQGAVRRCALRRARLPKSDLLRFVLGPDGSLIPDLRERLPGRGVWITAAREVVEEAVRANIFTKAFQAPVKVAKDLPDQVEALLAQAALGAFGLANKAGEVVFGFAKIEQAIERGEVQALVHASDAAEDGCRKLDAKLRAAGKIREQSPVRAFSGTQLNLASGRPNVIHAAMLAGGAAAKFLQAARRLERYREGVAAFAHPTLSDVNE